MISKETWKLLSYILIVGLGIFLLVINYSTRKFDSGVDEVIEQSEIMEQETPRPQVAAPKPVTPSAEDYTRLVAQYEGRRIQFDINCQAIPSNASYANGTELMFDNRSGDARNIVIDGISYYFAGYGYKILKLSGSQLPKAILLSCGSAVNVGQILLQ